MQNFKNSDYILLGKHTFYIQEKKATHHVLYCLIQRKRGLPLQIAQCLILWQPTKNIALLSRDHLLFKQKASDKFLSLVIMVALAFICTIKNQNRRLDSKF